MSHSGPTIQGLLATESQELKKKTLAELKQLESDAHELCPSFKVYKQCLSNTPTYKIAMIKTFYEKMETGKKIKEKIELIQQYIKEKEEEKKLAEKIQSIELVIEHNFRRRARLYVNFLNFIKKLIGGTGKAVWHALPILPFLSPIRKSITATWNIIRSLFDPNEKLAHVRGFAGASVLGLSTASIALIAKGVASGVVTIGGTLAVSSAALIIAPFSMMCSAITLWQYKKYLNFYRNEATRTTDPIKLASIKLNIQKFEVRVSCQKSFLRNASLMTLGVFASFIPVVGFVLGPALILAGAIGMIKTSRDYNSKMKALDRSTTSLDRAITPSLAKKSSTANIKSWIPCSVKQNAQNIVPAVNTPSTPTPKILNINDRYFKRPCVANSSIHSEETLRPQSSCG